jgi:hypothetical protein
MSACQDQPVHPLLIMYCELQNPETPWSGRTWEANYHFTGKEIRFSFAESEPHYRYHKKLPLESDESNSHSRTLFPQDILHFKIIR